MVVLTTFLLMITSACGPVDVADESDAREVGLDPEPPSVSTIVQEAPSVSTIVQEAVALVQLMRDSAAQLSRIPDR